VTVVVIGGSRRVTRLADEVVRRLEKIVERRKPVLVYSATRREFVAVRGPDDLAALRHRVGAPDDRPRGAAADEDQAALF